MDSTSTMPEAITAAVQAGTALLDEKVPGWVDRINLDTLSMTSVDDCVAAQATQRNFWEGVRFLGIDTDTDATRVYGFNPPFALVDEIRQAYYRDEIDGNEWDRRAQVVTDQLCQAWKDVIVARREAAASA